MKILIIVIPPLMALISVICVICSIITNRRAKKVLKKININIGTKTKAEWLNEIRETKFRSYLKEKAKKN